MTCTIDVGPTDGGICAVRVAEAKTPNECVECRASIEPGERYMRYWIFQARRLESMAMCMACDEITTTFFENGHFFGEVWEDLRSACADDEITMSDLDKLSSAAVAKLEEMMGWDKEGEDGTEM